MHASDWHLFSDHGAGGIVKSRHDLIRRMDLPRRMANVLPFLLID